MKITNTPIQFGPKTRKYIAGALIAGTSVLQGCAGYSRAVANDIYANQRYLATQTDIKAKDFVKLEERFQKLKTWPMERDAWKHAVDSVKADSAFRAGVKFAKDSINAKLGK